MELMFAPKVSGAIMLTNRILYLECGLAHLASMQKNKQVLAIERMPAQNAKPDTTVKVQTDQNLYVSLVTIVQTSKLKEQHNLLVLQGPIIQIMVQSIE